VPKLVRQPSGPFGRCDPPEGAGSEPPPTVAGRWRHHIAVVTGGTLRPPASLSQPERLVRFRASPQDFTHCFRAPRGERRGARSKGARHEGRGTRGNEPGARHRGGNGRREATGNGQPATGNGRRRVTTSRISSRLPNRPRKRWNPEEALAEAAASSGLHVPLSNPPCGKPPRGNRSGVAADPAPSVGPRSFGGPWPR